MIMIQMCRYNDALKTGKLNNNGTMLLDLCKQTGLRILNGRCRNDKYGSYTYIGPNGSSLVDYVITSQ